MIRVIGILLFLLSHHLFAQEIRKDSLMAVVNELANSNIPEAASSVDHYTFFMLGCTLIKETHLTDGPSWFREYEITSDSYEFDFYDSEHTLHDLNIGSSSFILAFPNKSDVEAFSSTLKQLGVVCSEEKNIQMTSLDSISEFMQYWNYAINTQNTESLRDLYATNVQFYLRDITGDEVMDIKEKWFSDFEYYRQQLDNIAFRWIDHDLAQCVFIKKYMQDGVLKRVRAKVDLKRSRDGYKIVKETDQPSELKLAHRAEIGKIQKGKHYYTFEYWEDVRDDYGIGHDFIRYSMDLEVTAKNDREVKINMNWYSGRLREILTYATAYGIIENGILTFSTAAIPPEYVDEPIEITNEELESFTFKVLGKKTLVLLESETFKELEGEKFIDFE